jgi:hypothetical protein
MQDVLAIRNAAGNFDLVDANTHQPIATGYTNVNDMTLKLRRQGYTLVFGAIINDHPKYGKCRAGKFGREGCPTAHGVIEKKRNADGSMTFECRSCYLSTTLRSDKKTERGRNCDMETQANAFFNAYP